MLVIIIIVLCGVNRSFRRTHVPYTTNNNDLPAAGNAWPAPSDRQQPVTERAAEPTKYEATEDSAEQRQ